MRWMRLRPAVAASSGVARAPELAGPDSSSRSGPRTTSAKAGAALVFDGEAEVGGVEVDGRLHIVDEVADAGVLVGCGHGWTSLVVGGGEDRQQVPDTGVDVCRGALERGVAGLIGVVGGGRVGDAPVDPPRVVRELAGRPRGPCRTA